MKIIVFFFLNTFLFVSLSLAQTVVPISEGDLSPVVNARHDVSGILNSIRQNKQFIKRAARAFGIDPVLVASSIVGEHAMNVSFVDRAQDSLARARTDAAIWAQTNEQSPDKNLQLLISQSSYQECLQKRRDYDVWLCVVETWNVQNGYPGLFGQREFFRRFTSHFFNPNGHADIGLTFGMGQMSPVRALMVDDLVGQVGRRRINFVENGQVSEIFLRILDPQTVVYYVAATNSYAIAIYRSGDFDISQNPGIVATLYNNGNEKILLQRTRRQGRRPETNNLGKWVNQNIETIRAALD